MLKAILIAFFIMALLLCGHSQDIIEPPIELLPPQLPFDIVNLKICAVGDCTFGGDFRFTYENSFFAILDQENGDLTYFFRNVADILQAADLTLANMEGVLGTDEFSLADKTEQGNQAFWFLAPPEFSKIFQFGGVDAVTLANNHSLDYGEAAYLDTKEALRQAGVTPYGYGEAVVMERQGLRIGLIGHNLLGPLEEGVNLPALKKEAAAQIELLRQTCDMVIIQVHWGEEYAAEANEEQRDFAHFLIDQGADLVLGHHPHILQEVEFYQDRYIVYSLGNFVFGGNKRPYDMRTMIFSQTFRVNRADGQVLVSGKPDFLPCYISSAGDFNNYQPTPVQGPELNWILPDQILLPDERDPLPWPVNPERCRELLSQALELKDLPLAQILLNKYLPLLPAKARDDFLNEYQGYLHVHEPRQWREMLAPYQEFASFPYRKLWGFSNEIVIEKNRDSENMDNGPIYQDISRTGPEPMVDLEKYIPGIRKDVKYAQMDNFTSQIIYDNDRIYLRKGTAAKLKTAEEKLKSQGLGLLIWDAYRPPAAQFRLWEAYPDANFVADPNQGFSDHSRGSCVDVTLVDKEGQQLPMPSEFDAFGEEARVGYTGATEKAAANAALLAQVMTEAGFEIYNNEWWHFSDSESQNYEPVVDLMALLEEPE
ncbi:MAG: CapA family protein [Clostridiales bacterium]|nr:CapA family protein [Clostridiales bacterium]MDR2713872.1 CapA family protein [Clostridiales bacterium]